jgi:site-specific DNA-methyltransferase (adenine-specific)
MNNNKVHFMSTNYEWETPDKVFEPLAKEFGIEFDVCATAANRKAKNFYSKEDNSLIKEWQHTRSKAVWMNPPYDNEIGKWVRKAYEEAKNGVTTVALLPARTDTAWFHNYILDKQEIRFLKGRIKFKEAKSSAPFPSMVVIFHGRKNKTITDKWFTRYINFFKK